MAVDNNLFPSICTQPYNSRSNIGLSFVWLGEAVLLIGSCQLGFESASAQSMASVEVLNQFVHLVDLGFVLHIMLLNVISRLSSTSDLLLTYAS